MVWLKQRTGARKAKRGKLTRAQFVQMLVDEVKPKGLIPTVIPELKEKQQVAEPAESVSDRRDTVPAPGINAGPGGKINRGANLRVKGAKPNASQIANAEKALTVAAKYKAPAKVMVSLIEVAIVESTLKHSEPEVRFQDHDSTGFLQARVGLHGDLSLEKQVEIFLTKGFTGEGGALSIYNANPGLTPGQIGEKVEGGPTAALYDTYRGEAEAWVRAFSGGNLEGLSGMDAERSESFTVRQPYYFERGKDESSWDAIGRLAEEVQWRRFMRRGRLYYISDERLFAQKPELRIAKGRDGVDAIEFDVDIGVRTKRLG